jgi:hypothetical protein
MTEMGHFLANMNLNLMRLLPILQRVSDLYQRHAYLTSPQLNELQFLSTNLAYALKELSTASASSAQQILDGYTRNQFPINSNTTNNSSNTNQTETNPPNNTNYIPQRPPINLGFSSMFSAMNGRNISTNATQTNLGNPPHLNNINRLSWNSMSYNPVGINNIP